MRIHNRMYALSEERSVHVSQTVCVEAAAALCWLLQVPVLVLPSVSLTWH